MQISQPFLVREVLQPSNHLHDLPLDLLPTSACPSCAGALRAGHKNLIKLGQNSVALLAILLWMQPSLAFCAVSTHCWVMSSSLTSTSKFSARLILICSSLNSVDTGICPNPGTAPCPWKNYLAWLAYNSQ